jgi:hypothetical protein
MSMNFLIDSPVQPARWSLTVNPEVDASLREYLGAQGMKKGDLSRFVEEAVRWRLFDQTTEAIRSRLEGEDEAALQALIDDALDAVRHP